MKIANEFSRKVKTIQFGVMFVVSSVDSVDAAHGLTVKLVLNTNYSGLFHLVSENKKITTIGRLEEF